MWFRHLHDLLSKSRAGASVLFSLPLETTQPPLEIVNRQSKLVNGEIMPKPASKKTEKPVQELAYEEALAELEEIVSALEDEQNQLDDAIKLFERGQALAALCGVLLEAAELKVKQVAGDDLIPFEDLSE